jgi:hypothetical protein
MTDPLIQWIIGQIGLAGVASLALMMLRQVYEERVKEQKMYSETLKAYTDKMMTIVEKNIEANTALHHSVGTMQQTIGSLSQTILNLQQQVQNLQAGRHGNPTRSESGD